MHSSLQTSFEDDCKQAKTYFTCYYLRGAECFCVNNIMVAFETMHLINKTIAGWEDMCKAHDRV